MTLRADLLAQKAEIEAKLAILNSAPEDIYNFGTVALFAAAGGSKWHYLKTGEEEWQNIDTHVVKSLSEWIVDAKYNTTYFEIYILTVPETPLYAS